MLVKILWVDSAEHVDIKLHAKAGQHDRINWFVQSDCPPVKRAHELGHQMGLKDEYVGTLGDPSNSKADNSIMGNFRKDPKQAAAKQRHATQIGMVIATSTDLDLK